MSIHTQRNTCTCTHMDRELHLHLLMLWAQGDMENYRERTLVASISSLVSEKCDLKGRRIKGDKLFSTTVNRRKLWAVQAHRKEKKDIIYGFSWVQGRYQVKIRLKSAVEQASISQNMNIDEHMGIHVSLLWATTYDAGKYGSAISEKWTQCRQRKGTLSSYICTHGCRRPTITSCYGNTTFKEQTQGKHLM